MEPFGHTNRTQSSVRWALWMGLALACPAVLGQVNAPGDRPAEPPLATQPASGPYWLRVKADRVNLRSRPDANSIVVARVERDTVLRAVDSQFGWHRLLPPEGVFSFVSAAHVERRGDSDGRVTVRSGTLRVRVGSLVQNVNPQDSEVQALLERGSPVRIVGEQGEWLKIVPPDGVFLYVSNEHVERVSDEAAAKLHTALPASSQPSGARTAAQTQPAATRLAEQVDLSGRWGQNLLLVEADIGVEAAQPGLKQTWDELLARLRPISVQREELAVARLAGAWIAQLEERIADRDAVRAAEEILRRTDRERAQHEREIQRVEQLREQAATRPAFEARGVIRRSFAVGERDAKRWYKLQNPLTQRVEVYLEIDAQSQLDPDKFLGQYVGVKGPRRFEKDLGADVVRVETIAILAPEKLATQPARPTP